uniref:Uncharacterized protein n=1 Tax=Lutzomyia longipalpis TaxID=7200 RepID=A0A1B0GIF2_LUTLO
MWQAKKEEQFPVVLISDEDSIGQHCTRLFGDINKSWEPLLSAALGYPQTAQMIHMGQSPQAPARPIPPCRVDEKQYRGDP